MRPHFNQLLEISTPGPATVDPETGNPRPGTPTVQQVMGRLSQSPVANIASQFELMATQQTVISLWSVLVPAGTVMTALSTVTEVETGRQLAISGDVADRPHHRPKFRAAAARLISDMQA